MSAHCFDSHRQYDSQPVLVVVAEIAPETCAFPMSDIFSNSFSLHADSVAIAKSNDDAVIYAIVVDEETKFGCQEVSLAFNGQLTLVDHSSVLSHRITHDSQRGVRQMGG